MNIKKQFNDIFSYKTPNSHTFIIPDSPNNIIEQPETDVNIFSSYEKNVEYLKIKYNLIINSDITFREFEIKISNKKFKACLLFIDGLIDSASINEFILSPLFLRNSIKMNSSSSFNPNNKRTVNPQKFDLKDFLEKNLISQNSLKMEKTYNKTFENINAGYCALFVDTLDVVFCVEAKDIKGRSISEPQNENIVRGPHQAFIENIRTNTSLIRKIINNENLIIENINIGKVTKTQVAVCYLQNIANNDLVAEVKYRLNNLKIDSLISSGQLENLIKENLNNIYPEILATERPDRTSNYLLNGRVAILVNGSPYALIVPAILLDFLSTSEDLNLNHFYSNFLKLVRILALFITILLPGLYISITIYHDEFLPSELLFAIASSREKIPSPIIIEIIMMEISFELIREAGVRVPSAFGQTIGIVGALILGQSAVTAHIVSPILVIIVAITGISEFAIPDFSFAFGTRIFRFVYIILGYIAGLFGVAAGIFIHLSLLLSTTSFGVSIFSYADIVNYPISPLWKNEKRPSILNTKRPSKSEEISMPWRNENKS